MRKVIGLLTGLFLFITSIATVSAQEYEVKKGDTLWEIAEEHDMTVEEIVELNSLKTTTIQPKQRLYLTTIHEVTQGESLYTIAKKYDVSIDDLKKWNELKSDTLAVGQELRIKEGKKQDEKTVTKKEEKEGEKVTSKTEEPKQAGKTMTVTATAYTAQCADCSGITATGINLNENRQAKVIAVDPNVIPLGSRVYVEGYGEAIAGDTGGAIKGNKIDLHVPTKEEAYQWGIRTVNITVLD